MAMRGDALLVGYVKSLSAVLTTLHRYVKEHQPVPVSFPLHSFQPGDFVWVRSWGDQTLSEK